MADRTCRVCGALSPEQAQFCMACGTAFAARCVRCGTENPAEASFCIGCGAALAEPRAGGHAATGEAIPRANSTGRAAKVETEGAAPIPPETLPEERRQATVLFADISGYTAIAERMDPEAVKSLVSKCLLRLAEEVELHGGRVDKFIGDNVMAVFGAPVAHEDDPERAVRAGLAMQVAMAEMEAETTAAAGVSFKLRVGINSGEVLSGQVGDSYTVIGDTVNVASRLEGAGEPGTVTVGASTRRLTGDSISYEELEPLALKGKSEPVPAWRALEVLGPTAGSRPERASTPLIGRDDESGLLESLFERVVREGRPHLVTVIGEAGVGKSRLLRELEATIASRPDGPAVRIGRCPPYGAGTTYWALGEMIRQHFEILDSDNSATAWHKLLGGVADLVSETDEPPERFTELIARPLGIEPPPDVAAATTLVASGGTAELEADAAQQVRDRLFSAVRSLVEAASRRQPLLLAVEDVHWADEGMLDLIDHLARWVRGPLLLVCIGRDELLDRRPGWGGGRRNTTTISLEPLPGDHVERLVGTLLPDAAENGARDSATRAEIVRRVAERSGGNPLFAEEMVNRIREEGGEEAGTLPESVQAVLAARLDALRRGERRVLEHAAVVGEVFWEGSLIGFSDEQGVNLAEALSLLEEKDLIVPSAGSRLAGEQEYAFKHGLIRDVAYERLPKAVRARKHGEVGRFIEERAGERGDAVVALVAEHHARAATLGAEANLPDEELVEIRASALRHLEAAGDSAAALHSNQEALANFTNALELAQVPDDARARIGEKQGDVDLRLGRVDAAVAIWEQCLEYHRGEESLARVGDLHRKIGAGLWHKGERSESIAHYQEGIDLLKDGPPCLELVRLYEEAASLYMHTGDNMLAIYASERALRLAERLGEAAAASRAHGIFGRVFGRIGDSDKALENLERSVELAKRSDPGEAVRALLTLGSHLEVSASDLDAASAAYAEALELAEQFGDLPAQVELHAAIARLAASRADWQEVERASGASAALAEREGLVGMLCFPELMRGWLRWRKGELDDAVDTLRSARELGTAAGRTEVVFPALLLEGWVLSGRGDHAGAETAFSLALDVCERAGLIAQSIEATAARAVNLALGGNAKRAADAAFEAASLSERLADPAGHAAALEATGSVDEDPVAAATKLADARDAWSEAGRPIDAARSEMLRGWRLAGAGSKDAEAAAEAAATAFEAHGFTQLADRSRELVA